MNENSLSPRIVVALALASGLTACQGVFNVDFDKAHLDGGASSSSSSGSHPGSSGEPGSSTATVPNPTTAGTLAGKWDLTGAIPGESAENGTLDIGPNSFRVDLGGAVFDFSASAPDRTELTYTRYETTREIAVEHRAAPVFWGVIPISKGGSLTFSDPAGYGKPCVLEIGAPNGSFQCQDRVGSWPNVLPQPIGGLRYEMTRLDTASSSFGDLGGHWQAKAAGGSDVCTIDIVGNKITASCPKRVKRMGGTFEATFGADAVSGRTSSGVEFAGHKR
jgi:hypothetical protein